MERKGTPQGRPRCYSIILSIFSSVKQRTRLIFPFLFILISCSCENEKEDPLNQDPVELSFAIMSIPSESDIFEGYFSKYINIFGVHMYATTSTADSKVIHAANVLAQYIDNDEDGFADNQAALDSLLNYHPSLVMFSTENQAENFFDDPPETAIDMFDNGRLIAQDLYGSETIPPGTGTRFDASLEEVWHLVTNGYMLAYPDVFGDAAGSIIADNMDLARGGHFTSVPNSYPDDAWYHYDDWTCDYECMIFEYFYWALTTLLGAQSDEERCHDISIEWELCTPDALKSVDPGMYSLLTDPQYNLPTVLPDGSYSQ